ncbi:MAG: hypothetical protein ABI986_09230, partial [Chloroflexota bacterium]
NAWLAFLNARRWGWGWGLTRSSLPYLWAFGVGELLVLFTFRAKLVLAHPIAWLNLVTLTVNGLAALVGAVDLLRPSAVPHGTPLTSTQKIPADDEMIRDAIAHQK